MSDCVVWQYATDGMISMDRFRPIEFAKVLREAATYPRYATTETGWANFSPEHSALIQAAFLSNKDCTLTILTNKPGHESFQVHVIREPGSIVQGCCCAGFQVSSWSVRWIRRKQCITVDQASVPVSHSPSSGSVGQQQIAASANGASTETSELYTAMVCDDDDASSSTTPFNASTISAMPSGTCSVCIEDISHAEMVKSYRLDNSPGTCATIIRLPCDHIFHADCLSQWFKLGNTSCPNCKTRPTVASILSAATVVANASSASSVSASAAAAVQAENERCVPISAHNLCVWLAQFTSTGVQTDGQMYIHWEPLTLPGTGARPAPSEDEAATVADSSSHSVQPRDDNAAPIFGPVHEDIGSFVMHWKFPNSVQDKRHDVSAVGSLILGRNYTSYLPACSKGVYVLSLMKQAFVERKLFHVGTSLSGNAHATVSVTYGSVHHRSSRVGGDAWHGYPSAHYLLSAQDDLEVLLRIKQSSEQPTGTNQQLSSATT